MSSVRVNSRCFGPLSTVSGWGRLVTQDRKAIASARTEAYLTAHNPPQQICQPVSRQNYPSVSNPARANNVSRRKHGSRRDHRAVQLLTLRNPNPPTVTVSDLRRNLEALFGPGFSVCVGKFGKLTQLKLLRVLERRGLVSEPGRA
jgi:hypothetical protein